MKKNVIKNMTKKSKIICGVCILLFIALVGVIIFKCFNTTGSVNQTGQNIDNNSAIEQKEKSKELITISGYTVLYNFLSTDDINNIYSIDDNKYSIIISGESNSIVVNDSIIFESKQKLYSVDLYYDIFVIYTASDSSDFKSILYLIDLDGNIVKEVDNVLFMYRNFYDDKMSYSIDNYDYYGTSMDNFIYKAHSSEHHLIKYSNSNITDEVDHNNIIVYTPECSYDKMCLLYEEDDLKIEIGVKDDINENGEKILSKGLYVNGNKVQFASNLESLSFLPDGYIFITSRWMDGFDDMAQIIDRNGNVVTDFNEIIGDYITSNPLMSDISNSFSNDIFTINGISKKAIDDMGLYLSGSSAYPNDYELGKVFKFYYLGNGRVGDGYVDDIIYVGDFWNWYY